MATERTRVGAARPAAAEASPFQFAVGLAIAMGVGPLALQGLVALGPLVTQDLGLSRAEFGSLATLTFATAAVASMLVANILDEISARGGLLTTFTGAGLAIAMVAVAPNYRWLLLAVAVSGATQSLSNPVTNRLIVARKEHGARGLMMGVKQSGVQLTQFVAGASLPAVAVVVGWRVAMAGTVLVVIVGALLGHRVTSGLGAAKLPTGVRTRGRTNAAPMLNAVWWLTGYALLVGAALQATNVYTPLFAFEGVGLTATHAGMTAAVAGGAGVVARLAYGGPAERWASPRPFLGVLAAAATLGAVAMMAAANGGSPSWLWLGTIVHGLSALASNVVAMMALVMLVPPQQLGRATGVLVAGMYVGFASGPIVFGALVDRTGQWPVGWMFVALLYCLALLLMAFWRPGRSTRRPPISCRTRGRSGSTVRQRP